MSNPFMQLYVADYLGDTRHLTTEQHGAYLLLLMTMWRADGVLPNDDKKLARIVGCTSSRWARIKDEVLEFFDLEDGVLTNARLKLELKKASEKSNQRAEAGSRGGKAKALKTHKVDVANANDLLCHSSEPEPDSKNDLKVIVLGEPTTLPVKEAFDRWNEMALRRRLPVAKTLTDQRRRHIRARLAEAGLPGWQEALSAVENSPLCRGENDRGWRADIDFVCQPKSFAKLREGSYGNGQGSVAGPPQTPEAIASRTRHEALLASLNHAPAR